MIPKSPKMNFFKSIFVNTEVKNDFCIDVRGNNLNDNFLIELSNFLVGRGSAVSKVSVFFSGNDFTTQGLGYFLDVLQSFVKLSTLVMEVQL